MTPETWQLIYICGLSTILLIALAVGVSAFRGNYKLRSGKELRLKDMLLGLIRLILGVMDED